MSRRTLSATVGILSGLCLGASALAAHPLDPLTADELKAVGEVLRADGLVDDGTRFPQIRLEEPEKAKVLAWRPGAAAPPRQAFAVLRQDGAIREAVVDLGSKKVVSLTAREGAQSPVLFEEWGSAQEATLADPRFMEALAKRGVTDKDKVFCAPFSMGYFGVADHEGRRLLKVGCFDLRPSVNSMFGWPIEGLYAVVDLHAGKVIELHNSGVVPISPAEMNFAENSLPSLRDPLKPVTVATPSGANVSIDGHTVGWQNWRFHVALDRRVGMTLSTVSYAGRPILYRAYQSEMFVPYHDPDYGWYSRTYFDTGEYGAGLLTTPLQVGIDCPANAYFMGATINDDTGGPLEIPNAICIFERNTGDPVWRHAEPLNQTYEGRPDVELVARFVPTIGNYDYVIDFVFDLAGEITTRVGATGIDALKGVKSASMADATAAADTDVRHARGTPLGGREPRPLHQLPARPRRRRPGQHAGARRVREAAARRCQALDLPDRDPAGRHRDRDRPRAPGREVARAERAGHQRRRQPHRLRARPPRPHAAAHGRGRLAGQARRVRRQGSVGDALRPEAALRRRRLRVRQHGRRRAEGVDRGRPPGGRRRTSSCG